MHIIWNGKNSNEINGLIIQSIPPITKAKMRVQSITVDGRDGDILENLGYSSYEKEFEIGLTKNADIEEIMSYFNGKGDLITSEEPDKVYKCEIINQIDYARILAFREAKVRFHVQPYKFLKDEEYQIISNSDSVINCGSEPSKPIIHLEGDGLIEFKINGQILFTYKFPDNENNVVIDSSIEEAYLDNTLKNRNMQGDFPILKCGENIIEWNGNLTNVEILANSRWL